MSDVELMLFAKRLCDKWGMKLNKLNRDPHCKETFELLCNYIGKCEIHIFDSADPTIRKLVACHKPNINYNRGPCLLRITPKGLTYSLLCRIAPKSPYYTCKRCDGFVRNRPDYKARHRAFCAHFSANEIALGHARTLLRFPHAKYRKMKMVLDQLRDLSVPIADEFTGNVNLAVFDTESYCAPLGGNGTSMGLANYSESLALGSLQTTAVVAVSYRHSDTVTGSKVFYKADSPSNFLRHFVQFLLDLSIENAEYLINERFSHVFSYLDNLETKNRKNGFLIKRVNNARKSLETYCSKYCVIGYNSGGYDIQTLSQYKFLQILKEIDGEVRILKRQKRYIR